MAEHDIKKTTKEFLKIGGLETEKMEFCYSYGENKETDANILKDIKKVKKYTTSSSVSKSEWIPQ